jgi:hypothetical protein
MSLPVNYIDVEQQSPEWHEMRKGCVTGSMVKNTCAKMAVQPKNGPTKYKQCREDYMIDVVTTRLTGRMAERYVTKAMEDGIEREVLAISEYETRRRVMTEPIGIVFHPSIEWYASSPDFLLGTDIVGEAKCPTEATHLRYILEARDAKTKGLDYVPEEYLPQVKAHLSCTDRPLCHFVSYNPHFPTHLQLLVTEWRRDHQMVAEQDAEVVKFLTEAAQLEASLKEMSL